MGNFAVHIVIHLRIKNKRDIKLELRNPCRPKESEEILVNMHFFSLRVWVASSTSKEVCTAVMVIQGTLCG